MNGAATRALPRAHLDPGCMIVTREPQVVSTVLGPCVAVTMFDRSAGLAAICHAMLPHGRRERSRSDGASLRYVELVLPLMLEHFTRAEIALEEIELKMFGGATVLASPTDGSGRHFDVGAANVASARRFLREHGLALAAENTGGFTGRKILFNTATGDVLHRHLARDLREGVPA
jgi:chemotaxis protein CheD